MLEKNQITKEAEYKLFQLREEAFLKFKDYIYENGTDEMKKYNRRQLKEIFFKQNYTIVVPQYDSEDGLEYQCITASL